MREGLTAGPIRRIEAIKHGTRERRGMQHLIIRGDPGIRRDAVIEYEGEELVCFGINVQGGWHGPDEPQLWCTVGSEDEREAYDKREYVPHWLDVDAVDAEEVEVLSEKGELAV